MRRIIPAKHRLVYAALLLGASVTSATGCSSDEDRVTAASSGSGGQGGDESGGANKSAGGETTHENTSKQHEHVWRLGNRGLRLRGTRE